jgi:probable F420-dependent oxidoreductase
MKFGAVLPTSEIGNDSGAVRAWAQAVDEMGYDRLIVYDHVLGAVHDDRNPPLGGPYTENEPFREPMVLFGHLAAITTHVELMTGVLVLPQRNAPLVAKQATEIDLLSGGRFVLGVGTGWNWVEYEALGAEFENRGKRVDEQVALIRRLWTERVVDFDGRFHRVDRAGIFPLPERDIPIWFGGASEPAMRRAAAVGDGFYFVVAGSRVVAALERLRSLLSDNGRDPETFPAAAQVYTAGGLDNCLHAAHQWRDAAGSHVFVSTMRAPWLLGEGPAYATVDDHITVARQALELLRSAD